MRHRVIRPTDRPWTVQEDRPDGGKGFRRQTLIDDELGSVHMTVGWSSLDPGGEVGLHVHSYEESFYVTEGVVDALVAGRSQRFGVDDYGVVPVGTPHAFRAPTDGARWLEVTAPQVRSHPLDTFAVPGAPDWHGVEAPDWASPLRGPLGHFVESQLPPASQLQMEGYSGGDVTGIRLKMLIDRVLGAQHMNVFMVEFEPGGAGNSHDHPFEEAYVLLSGAADALLEGESYVVGAGDVVWAGVGAVHGFFARGQEPVRWIEVQAPQPPSQHAFRFARPWSHVEQAMPT